MAAVLTFRTLRDYASTYTLDCYCPACRHRANLVPLLAASRVGWGATLAEVRGALRCSRCGHKGAEVRVVSDGRPPAHAGTGQPGPYGGTITGNTEQAAP